MRLITVRPNLFDFQSEYTFGSEDNTTFLVYVYDFQPPLWIIISFSQHPKLDLLVSGDTSTEYDLAPTLREFCGGYGLANFRWDGIMTSIMTSLPYFGLKLSCGSLLFADRKKSNDL